MLRPGCLGEQSMESKSPNMSHPKSLPTLGFLFRNLLPRRVFFGKSCQPRREVYTKTRSTSSFSPRTELRSFATPTTQCRPTLSGISTVGAPNPSRGVHSALGALGARPPSVPPSSLALWKPHSSFSPPAGVVVPAWAWLPEAKKNRPLEELMKLPTPNRSRSLQRVVGSLNGGEAQAFGVWSCWILVPKDLFSRLFHA